MTDARPVIMTSAQRGALAGLAAMGQVSSFERGALQALCMLYDTSSYDEGEYDEECGYEHYWIVPFPEGE